MPVTSPIDFRPLTEREFHALDYRVMGLAFACQHDLGRLCDEKIYKADLSARLMGTGLSVRREVPLTLTHRDFCKRLFLDLVVDEAGLFEAKAAEALVGDHERQILTYLFLLGSRFGKLINFRPASVEGRTVNAVVTPEDQRRFSFLKDRLHVESDRERLLPAILDEVLHDWGAFLDIALYSEVLIHFLGGENMVCRNLPLTRDGLNLGEQKFKVLDETTGFHLTAVAGPSSGLESHLRRMLQLTPLQRLQWVNFNRHQIEFVTLQR
jgi:GxxExxY protein